jgi:hypothetical protein
MALLVAFTPYDTNILCHEAREDKTYTRVNARPLNVEQKFLVDAQTAGQAPPSSARLDRRRHTTIQWNSAALPPTVDGAQSSEQPLTNRCNPTG